MQQQQRLGSLSPSLFLLSFSLTQSSGKMSTAAPVNIRRADADAPLPANYSTTPHGTIYGSTPGGKTHIAQRLSCGNFFCDSSYISFPGTRVIYDRNTLLALSNSQLAKTPPTKMAYIAGVTKTGGQDTLHPNAAAYRKAAEAKREEEERKKTYNPFSVLNNDSEDVFDMEE